MENLFSYEEFIKAIASFTPERQRELILEYHDVFVRMLSERESILKRFPVVPGARLQRQAAACYQDGSFLVLWESKQLMLKLL
jgi:hypothetical protein